MKTYLYPFLFLLTFLFGITDTLYSQETDSIYTNLDQLDELPNYPEGDQARRQYLMDNISYPKKARESGVEGTVYTTFIVEPDGRITNIEILRGIGGGCDKEAIRILENMPRWEPGKIDGEAVRVKFNMPFRFKLAESSSDNNEGCGFFNFF